MNSKNPFEGYHRGLSWSSRARLGGLNAVVSDGSEREQLLMHASSTYGAKVALAACKRIGIKKGVVLDFGCGIGRLFNFFSSKGWRVIGTDVTSEMLDSARERGLPEGTELYLTDGVSLPLQDQSVDLVWVWGVLKYAFFDDDSLCRGGKGPNQRAGHTFYQDIIKELYRVLKPGRYLVNGEMCVNTSPDTFVPDFEEAGFVKEKVRVTRRYTGLPERLLMWRQWHRFPPHLVIAAGEVCASFRYRFDNPNRQIPEKAHRPSFQDQLFLWQKPGS